MTITARTIADLAHALPGVTDGTWYGKPAFMVVGRGFARLHEDGETLVARIGMTDRDFLLKTNPAVFHITEHYRNYPAILARLATLTRTQAADLLDASWCHVAPKKLVAARNAALVGVQPGSPKTSTKPKTPAAPRRAGSK